MLKRRILALTIPLLFGCVKVKDVRTPSPAIMIKPLVTRRMHVDIDFTKEEYRILVEAGKHLENETPGRVRIEFLQDLDMSRPFMIAAGGVFVGDHWRIVRVTAESRAHANLNERFDGLNVLGLCNYEDRTIFMVSDGDNKPRIYQHIAEHEYLHSMGLKHTKDPKGIMAKFVASEEPLDMHDSDREAFCNALDCNVKEIWK